MLPFDELNRSAVALARKTAPQRAFVGGSVGPAGRFVEPVGDAGFDEMIDIFAEQISSLPLPFSRYGMV